MSFLNFATDLPDEPIVAGGMYLGTVVSNVDPLQLGRVRVRVRQLFPSEAIPDQLCPWALQRRPLGFGGNTDRSSFAVPEIGSQVWVQFLQNSVYSLAYETAPVDLNSKIPAMSTNYPKRYGYTDPDGSSLVVDTLKHTVDYIHQSGTEIHINEDKSVDIIFPNDLNRQVARDSNDSIGRDEIRDIERDQVENVIRDVTKTVGGNKSETITGNLDEAITGNHDEVTVGNITITATGNVIITGATVTILPTTPGSDKVKLGATVPTDFLALLAALTKIKTAFDAHTHGGVQTGAGTSGAPSVAMPAFVSGTDYTTQVKAS